MKIQRYGLTAGLGAILIAVLAVGFSPGSFAQKDKPAGIILAQAVPKPLQATRLDPITSFSYRVDIDGMPASFGISVRGIMSESDVTQVRLGNSSTTTLIPGPLKPVRLELSQAWTVNHEFFNWRQALLAGQPSGKRDVSIVFLGSNLKELFRLTYFRCWPAKWKGPDLNPRSNSVAMESLELVYDHLELK